MKGLNKILLVAAIAVPFAAQAELKSIDDAMMADVSGQSGLVIEAGFGSVNATDITRVNFSNSGITIDAFKWEVDAQAWNGGNGNLTTGAAGTGGATSGQALGALGVTAADNQIVSGVTLKETSGEAVVGGFIATGIKIAGSVDVTIDAVGDVAGLKYTQDTNNLAADTAKAGYGGIGITFANSDINFRVDSLGTYVATSTDGATVGGVLSDMGAIEIIGMNIDALSLVIHGN